MIKFSLAGLEQFNQIPSDSIDYAVMEHCPGVMSIKMVAIDAGWSDLGSWDAVWQALEKDPKGNAWIGDVIVSESTNNLIHANNRL